MLFVGVDSCGWLLRVVVVCRLKCVGVRCRWLVGCRCLLLVACCCCWSLPRSFEYCLWLCVVRCLLLFVGVVC